MRRSGENVGGESTGEQVTYPEKLREVGKFFLNNCESVEEAVESAACVVGVYANVKPAGVVTNGWKGEAEQEEFEDNLRGVGLEYTVREISHGAFQQYFVSRDSEKAKELQLNFERLWSGEPVDRELGRLLGYPETAIDYVSRGGEKGVKSRDTLIVHSPEYFQEEYDAYEGKLYGIMNDACPELMEAKGRNEKRGLGQRVLEMFKK